MTPPLVRHGVAIDDTYAEAFSMKATRLLITAHDLTWARHAAVAATGFATSVIGCGCEAGIERELDASQTPDGRPGCSVLLFAASGKTLAQQLERRVGQCVMTCPTTAVYASLPEGSEVIDHLALGQNLRYFGDGWQISKVIAGQRYWRIPVMDGEFVVQEMAPVTKAVGGGNLLLLARDTEAALTAAEAMVQAMRQVPNVILPFPGGVVRSGSKVGSRYASLSASTNDAYCPGLRGLTAASALDSAVRCVLEIVIDGLSAAAVAAAMRAGLQAGIAFGAARGLLRLSAGHYGGKLGPHHFHLHPLLAEGAAESTHAEGGAA
jgi:formylmethanofuran--tetrahydromethanopterin N-formyltransferase